MDEFYRIKRLPPYVFAIVNDLKSKARARGEDVIDLGMGNPTDPTPESVVKKSRPMLPGCAASSRPWRIDRLRKFRSARGWVTWVLTA